MKIIDYKEKKMIPLTYEENKSYKEQEACHICEEKFCMDKDDENYKNKRKVKDHCHYTGKFRGAAHSKCNLNYKVPKDIPIIIHDASYDTHFIINQLAEEFKGEFNCIGENMDKYITFSVPIKKECDDGKTYTYKLRFIDSFRFMSTSLSELVDNMSGILIEIMHRKFCCCEKVFILLNIWIVGKNLIKPHYHLKKLFYGNLNLEDISDEDYVHAQKVWDVFEIRNRGKYHDLYVQNDTLLLAEVFEHFRNKCLEICELDPVYFVSAPGLAWQACLKKTEVKLELLTDYDMLLIIEKGIRGGICQAVHSYAKANNKYMKNYDKSIESSYIEYLDAKICMGGQCLKNYL